MKHILKQNKINICHSFRLQPNIINVLGNLFTSRKAIIHITGLGSAFDSGSKLKLLARQIYKFIIKCSYKTVVQNKFDLEKIYNKKPSLKNIYEIHGSGVDCTKFTPKKKEKGRVKDKLNFLFLGRLINKKGIVRLIEIFKNVDNVKLNIVGWIDEKNPDSVNKKLFESLSNNIFYHGATENPLEFYNSNDIFIYPSTYNEGIPRVLLEAISCGMPIITSRGNGCEHCVYENGFLVDPESNEDIIKAIVQMMEADPSKLNLLSSSSRDLALKKFNKDIIFAKWLELYPTE
jgi:glycosyltransferase involved in cell wall biosynthesis